MSLNMDLESENEKYPIEKIKPGPATTQGLR